eukprot:Em0018g609a
MAMIMGQGGKIMATRRPRSWVKETKIMAMIMGQVCKILYKILGKTVWNLAAIIHSILILAMILVMFLVKIFSLGRLPGIMVLKTYAEAIAP